MSFANSFKALSHPVRREILNLLKTGRLSAGEIASRFELTGATISHHLTILKAADLIHEMKEKNFQNEDKRHFWRLSFCILKNILSHHLIFQPKS